MSGISPFHSNSYREVLAKNRVGMIEFPKETWSNVSAEGIDLVKKMTKLNPTERLTAAQALSHPWMSLGCDKSKVLSSAQENMRKYHNKENQFRFDVERIKPKFSFVGTSPIASRLASTNVGSGSSNLGSHAIDSRNHVQSSDMKSASNKLNVSVPR